MSPNLAVWIAVTFAIALAGLPVLAASKDKDRQKALQKYAIKVGLPLTADVHGRVVARLQGFERASLVGAIVGAAAGVPALIGLSALSGRSWENETALVIMSAVALGAVFGPAVTAVRQTLQPHTDRRVARATTPEIADYVPLLERLSGPLSVAVSLIAVVGGAWLFSSGQFNSGEFSAQALLLSPGAILSYLAVVTLIGGIVASRLVLQAGQGAETEHELAWDDALRAMTLRRLAVLPFVVATIGCWTLAVQLPTVVDDPTPVQAVVGSTALLGFTVVVIIASVINATRAPARHFLRRLWQREEQAA